MENSNVDIDCENTTSQESKYSGDAFVLLDFAIITDLTDKKTNTSVFLPKPNIIEIAAVKIESGEIKSHFHSFVSIDGYDAKNIEFDEVNFFAYDAMPEHLIGAPPFKDVAEKLHMYIGNGTILLCSSSCIKTSDIFAEFKERAKEFGYEFKNCILSFENIVTAAKLKENIEDSGLKFEDTDILQTARLLQYDRKKWTEVFADHDVFFDPDSKNSFDKGRNDPLSWALAFAKLFIAITDTENDENDSEKYPF